MSTQVQPEIVSIQSIWNDPNHVWVVVQDNDGEQERLFMPRSMLEFNEDMRLMQITSDADLTSL